MFRYIDLRVVVTRCASSLHSYKNDNFVRVVISRELSRLMDKFWTFHN